MNGQGKSDRFVVPANPPNKAAAAEAEEERERAKGNADGRTRPGRSAGPGVSSALDRVRQVARQDKEARFTALLHHVTVHRLMLAFGDLKKDAAPGADGVTWREYEQDLAANLRDLHERVQSGRYRASPSRRAYIPKADGRQRPLGIATDDSYCPPATTCRDVSGSVRSCAGQARVRGAGDVSMAGGTDIPRLPQRRWRGLVRRAAGLRCPDCSIRRWQSAWSCWFQGMQNRPAEPRRAVSCPVWIQW